MEEEELDPRVQVELEKLNSSTDVINKLELDLDEARAKFRQLLTDSSREIDTVAKRLGPCVEKARPYYEARMKARLALFEAQKAACRFEKASGAHEAAKEMVTLAEEGFEEKGMRFDQAWQEMLNHATSRVNDSEKERNESAEEHRQKSATYQRAEQTVQELQKSLKRSINKSRPYFEMKAKFHQMMDDQKRQVQLIEETIVMTKVGYSESLRELERISEEIHQKRKEERDKREALGVRECGVGAERNDDQRNENRDETDKTDVREMVKRKLKASISVCHDDHDGISSCKRTQSLTTTPISTPLMLDLRSINTPAMRVTTTMATSASTSFKMTPSSSTDKSSKFGSTSSSLTPSPVYERLEEGGGRRGDGMFHRSSSSTEDNDKLPSIQVLRIADEFQVDEISDSESLHSVDIMDDGQIDQLMKEESLKNSIEDILSPNSERMTLATSPCF